MRLVGVVMWQLKEAIKRAGLYKGWTQSIYVELADRYKEERGYEFASQETLSKSLGCSVKSLERALKTLEADGRIEALQARKGGGLYRDAKTGKLHGRSTRWKVYWPGVESDIMSDLNGDVESDIMENESDIFSVESDIVSDERKPRERKPRERKPASSSAAPKPSRARDGFQPEDEAETTDSEESTQADPQGVLPSKSGDALIPPSPPSPARPCVKCGIPGCECICGKCGERRPRYVARKARCYECLYKDLCGCGGLKSINRPRCRKCYDRDQAAA